MGWYQRRVHGEGAQFRNGNHPPSRQTRGDGFHPLSLEAEGSLPAARALAPSADRAHTTHYQQRPPLSLGGDAAGCVCVCARCRPISLPNVVAFLSRISLMRPTNSPEPPRSGKFFPKNHFTQDLSPLTERASCHTNRQKSSTAMRVVSRAGDSEARPLQRY